MEEPAADDGVLYDAAEAWCRQTIASGHRMMFDLQTFHDEISSSSVKFGLSFEALQSLFRNAHVCYMKQSRIAVRLRNASQKQIDAYAREGISILELAERANYPPSMMARLIVEGVAKVGKGGEVSKEKSGSSGSSGNNGENNASGGSTSGSSRKGLTEALRQPERLLGCAEQVLLPEYLHSEVHFDESSSQNYFVDSFSQKPLSTTCDHLPLSRLALEVRRAIDSDPMYGPRHDRERHNIGIEYELLLEQTLLAMDIPFETEAQLRMRGTARTPDVLLSCPVGIRVPKVARIDGGRNSSRNAHVNKKDFSQQSSDGYEWKVICWIDSKALFGDTDTHTNSVLPQAETYVHRFGPGLVIYWFGHAPLKRLGDSHGDVVVVSGMSIPELFLLPTGNFCGQGVNIAA